MDHEPRHVIWSEKYRPKTVSDCVLPEKLKTDALQIVSSESLPNMLFYGGPGTGKTTLAKAMCDDLGYTWMLINGSDEGRLLETLRTKIRDFASTVSFRNKKRKVVILDEADNLPADTIQPALRAFMQEFAGNCSFILTANLPRRIIEPLHSRCTTMEFAIPHEEKSHIAVEILHRTCNILDHEGVSYDKKVVAHVVKSHFPDFRRAINEIQRVAANGEVDEQALNLSKSTNIDEIVEMLVEKDFQGLRKWLAERPNLDITSICHGLYDKAYEKFDKTIIPQLVLIMAKYQYQNAFVADAEINTMAMFTEIMMEL